MATLNLKEISKKEDRLAGGHRACSGCGATICARQVMAAIDSPIVASCATGCLEITSSLYPFSSWKVPFIHSAFENSAATMSGVETAYRSLKKQGRITKNIKFVAFGGDGGTYDIGLQSLSGAMERGHNMLYVCYNNEAYMNTGIQRSGATPMGAETTTHPVGKQSIGKKVFAKDMTAIMVAHNIPYVAQASISAWRDLMSKVQKAMETEGPCFINALAPCQRGWRIPPENTIEIAKFTVDSCYWPLYEVVNGEYKITYKPKEKLPIVEVLKIQGRFSHLLKPENAGVIDEIQKEVDARWAKLLWLAKDTDQPVAEKPQ